MQIRYNTSFTLDFMIFFKNAHNINAVAKIQPKNLRNTDESRYPFAQLVDPVVKPRGFGAFFIKSSYKKQQFIVSRNKSWCKAGFTKLCSEMFTRSSEQVTDRRYNGF
ncbi:MAG: hypothetical protein A3F46_06465 [Legionellales bacterium RIFCSPHIGHO2_12_FULL_42_9]|nr:MAG: hypothetical protein A3F46_06465 [Legionellales bacterium RIFCSPHIGHO2_12_FULL_42_9]